jgi:hypothetical protein
MPRTVRVGEDAKSRLEELRAEIHPRTGQRVTQQELLTQLSNDAYEARDGVISPFRKSTVPLSGDEKEAVRRGRFASSAESSHRDVDDALYD